MRRKFVEPKIAHLGTQQNIVVAIAAALKCCSAEAPIAPAEGLAEAAPVCPVE
jgi:hypothetical protein